MKSPILKDSGKTPFVKKDDKGGMGTSPVTNVKSRTLEKEDTQQGYLQNGTAIKLRVIQPEDQRLVKEMFANLSKATIYHRYFGYVPDISTEFLAQFTCVNPEREITLVAEIRTEGIRQLIGVIQMVKDLNGTQAEFGILVADDWQKQGLGSLLIDFAWQVAKQQGITQFYAHFMAMNRAIDKLLQKKGFQVRLKRFATYYATLDLSALD